ncbi:hypothetical protein BV20DRAFT_979567 [Pilatotrama ljubarskyi]|nr:hypothetical protein BV20DRAFT_979567 [Pilatotrama ljubarskyi]
MRASKREDSSLQRLLAACGQATDSAGGQGDLLRDSGNIRHDHLCRLTEVPSSAPTAVLDPSPNRPLHQASQVWRCNGSERSKTKNKEKYDYLVDRDSTVPEPVFHYKLTRNGGRTSKHAPASRTKPSYSELSKSSGIKYRTQFSPVREVTLAFIFTTIEFCLDQWTDGTFNKSHTFAEKFYKTRYELHLKQVRNWCATDPGAAQTVRQWLYDRVRAAPVLAPRAGLSDSSKDRLRMELAAQAAASDSESDEHQGGLQMGAGGETR